MSWSARQCWSELVSSAHLGRIWLRGVHLVNGRKKIVQGGNNQLPPRTPLPRQHSVARVKGAREGHDEIPEGSIGEHPVLMFPYESNDQDRPLPSSVSPQPSTRRPWPLPSSLRDQPRAPQEDSPQVSWPETNENLTANVMSGRHGRTWPGLKPCRENFDIQPCSATTALALPLKR